MPQLWGLFGILHLSSLVLAAGIIFLLYFLLKNRSDKTKRIVMFILSLSGMAAVIYNLVTWGSPLEYLPLHLCSINAILLPIVVLTDNRTLGNVMMIWCVGAFLANTMQFYASDWGDLIGPTYLFFYLPHVFECAVPILLVKFGFVKKELSYLPRMLGITAGIYTVIHFVNLALNAYIAKAGLDFTVNYMYSLDHEGIPILKFLYDLLPFDYFYMYAVTPILLIYLAILYQKEIRLAWKAHKEKRAKV